MIKVASVAWIFSDQGKIDIQSPAGKIPARKGKVRIFLFYIGVHMSAAPRAVVQQVFIQDQGLLTVPRGFMDFGKGKGDSVIPSIG